MKKTLLSIGLVLCLVFGARAYTVTNDLNSIFAVFYWTNTAGVYTSSLNTNLAPGNSTVFSVSTNGNAGIGLQPTNATSPILMPWSTLPTNGGNLGIIFVNAMNEVAPAVETVPQTQLILKSYFLTDAIPSQANYWEWIDTWYWYVNSMWTNSQMTLSNSAAAIKNFTPKAGATLTFTRLSGGWSIGYFQLTATNYINIVPTSTTTYSENGNDYWTVSIPLTFSNNISPLISPSVFWQADAAFNNAVLQSPNLTGAAGKPPLGVTVTSNMVTISFTGQNGNSSTPGYSDSMTFWIQ